VVELAAAVDVPVLAVVGEVLEGVEVPAGVEVVSLVDRCGERRAREDTVAAVEVVVKEELARRCHPSV
jgi:hypothetical protein